MDHPCPRCGYPIQVGDDCPSCESAAMSAVIVIACVCIAFVTTLLAAVASAF